MASFNHSGLVEKSMGAGVVLVFQAFNYGQPVSMWKLVDDQSKIKYQGESHSGKVLSLKPSSPNSDQVVGTASLPKVLTWEEGRYTLKGEFVQHPSKWVVPSDDEDEEFTPIYETTPNEIFDLTSNTIDFNSMFKPVAIDDLSPAKKQRTGA